MIYIKSSGKKGTVFSYFQIDRSLVVFLKNWAVLLEKLCINTNVYNTEQVQQLAL